MLIRCFKKYSNETGSESLPVVWFCAREEGLAQSTRSRLKRLHAHMEKRVENMLQEHAEDTPVFVLSSNTAGFTD